MRAHGSYGAKFFSEYITLVPIVVVADILVSRTDKCYSLSRQSTLVEITMQYTRAISDFFGIGARLTVTQ